MYKNWIFYLLIFFIFNLLNRTATAGAWVEKKGEWLSISRFDYYNSGAFWDKKGNVHSAPTYYQDRLSEYGEYGLTDKITVGLNIFGLYIKNRDGKITKGSGDNVLFARYLIWSNADSAFSHK